MFKAFSIHFSISAFIVSIFIALVFFIWYPQPYFYTEGSSGILMVLIGVDLVLGPLMTFIIYKPHKKGLLFDLIIIASFQLSALLYGGHTIFIERPVYIVFNVDRFDAVPTSLLVKESKIRYSELGIGIFKRPKLVYAPLPEDPQEKSDFLMSYLDTGKDVKDMPEFYEPYSQHINDVVKKSINIDKKLKSHPIEKTHLKQLLLKHQLKLNDTAFLPLVGKEKKVVLIINRNTGTPLGILDFSPW